jgi:chromosome partitioning protein
VPRTIAFLNKKGGVGKTSTCHHLAGTLARQGRRVLLLDADPQASLTQGFWGPEAMRAIPGESSVAALFDPDFEPIPAALIRPSGLEGIDLVPGSEALTPYNHPDTGRWARHQGGMRDFLAEAREGYDLTLIDCPPNLHLCSWAALVAADAVVVPLQAEDYGAQGIASVQEAVAAVRTHANPSLHLLGYLITMFDKRLGIHTMYEATLRQLYGSEVFTSSFPLAKDYKEAVAARMPISHYKPKSAAAKAAAAVAAELLERCTAMGTDAGSPADRRVA